MRFRMVEPDERDRPPDECQFVPQTGGAEGWRKFCLSAVEWCEERMGDEGSEWCWDSATFNIFIYDPDVSFEFRLRWC